MKVANEDRCGPVGHGEEPARAAAAVLDAVGLPTHECDYPFDEIQCFCLGRVLDAASEDRGEARQLVLAPVNQPLDLVLGGQGRQAYPLPTGLIAQDESLVREFQADMAVVHQIGVLEQQALLPVLAAEGE